MQKVFGLLIFATIMILSAGAEAQKPSPVSRAASSLVKKRVPTARQQYSSSGIPAAGGAEPEVVSDRGATSEPVISPVSVADSLLTDSAAVASAGIIEIAPIPEYYFLPAIFDTYRFLEPDTLPLQLKENDSSPSEWLDKANYIYSAMDRAKQAYMIASPQTVKYNLAWLPEPPKKFEAVIDPSTQQIDIREVKVDPNAGENIVAPEIERKNWIHTFTGNIQFSQAFVSPNWYQGGNNNLNMIAQAIWNVKLNQAYHPNILFESTVQYKLGMNSAPDDSLRSYSISEDLFQINSTFGMKAARRWFYSLSFQFKTQLFNSYTSNTRNLRSAFMSPAEMTIGLGMTYNYVNPRKTIQFDASLAPLSYNMKICMKDDDKMAHSQFGIGVHRHSVSQYGSTAELKLRWAIAYNIVWQSRFFMFTDYDYMQADWENTISFAINRFLSTQIYVHARYDSSATYRNPDWHKLQLKEILSFGFSYKFATI